MDSCEFCGGTKGGEPGNENIYYGVICCDYCSVLVDRIIDRGNCATDPVDWARLNTLHITVPKSIMAIPYDFGDQAANEEE